METRIGRLGNNKELYIRYATALIDGIEKVIASFDIIRDVAKKMDGKVMNVRFENAIKELTDANKSGVYYRVYKKSYSFSGNDREMVLYLDVRSVQDTDCTCVYFDKDISNYISYSVERDMLNEGRISYEKIDTRLNKLEKSYREQIELWRDGINNYDNYKKMLNDALVDFGEKMSKINYLFKPHEIHSYDWESAHEKSLK